MKKRIFLVLLMAVLTLTLGIGGYVFAAGPTPTTSRASITIVGPEKELTIKSPFVVKYGVISISVPADGKIFAGDKIASVPVMVTNIGRMPYRVNINVYPAKPPTEDVWPGFDLRVNEKGAIYYPWQMSAIASGTTKEMTVEIFVAYGSYLVSFQGLTLDIWPAAETSAEKG